MAPTRRSASARTAAFGWGQRRSPPQAAGRRKRTRARRGRAGPGTRSALPDADVSTAGADVIVRLFPTPWAGGFSDTGGDPRHGAPGHGHQAALSPRLGGQALGQEHSSLSSPQFLPMSSEFRLKRRLSKKQSLSPNPVCTPPSLLGLRHGTGAAGSRPAAPGVREGACSWLSGPSPWRQSRPAVGPREGSPSHPSGRRRPSRPGPSRLPATPRRGRAASALTAAGERGPPRHAARPTSGRPAPVTPDPGWQARRSECPAGPGPPRRPFPAPGPRPAAARRHSPRGCGPNATSTK